jgi:hypothetical protein
MLKQFFFIILLFQFSISNSVSFDNINSEDIKKLNEADCKKYKADASKKLDPKKYAEQTFELKQISQKLLANVEQRAKLESETNYANDYLKTFYETYINFNSALYFLQLSYNYDVGAKRIIENFKNLERMNSQNLQKEITNSVSVTTDESKKYIACIKLLGITKLDTNSKDLYVEAISYIAKSFELKNTLNPKLTEIIKKIIQDYFKGEFIAAFETQIVLSQIEPLIPNLYSTMQDTAKFVLSEAKATDIDVGLITNNNKIMEGL